MNTECECSEEHGPCEDHMEVYAQYEGSSTRTADELTDVFIQEAIAAGVVLSETDAKDHERLSAMLDGTMDNRWLPTTEDAAFSESDTLREIMQNAESGLYELGYSVTWDDGFWIYKILPGCPLLED